MVKTPQKPLSPYSMRFTVEERAWLDQMAGDISLADFLRSIIFDEAQLSKRRRRRKSPIKDAPLLTSVLGEIGRSRLANNMNQLAKAANSGSLEVSPDTERALQQACADIQWMRNALMAALGINPESGHDS